MHRLLTISMACLLSDLSTWKVPPRLGGGGHAIAPLFGRREMTLLHPFRSGRVSGLFARPCNRWP